MLDPLLRGFVEAKTDEEADRRLESLFEERIDPLVRKIVARKLGVSDDLEDVAGDLLLDAKTMGPEPFRTLVLCILRQTKESIRRSEPRR